MVAVCPGHHLGFVIGTVHLSLKIDRDNSIELLSSVNEWQGDSVAAVSEPNLSKVLIPQLKPERLEERRVLAMSRSITEIRRASKHRSGGG